MITEAFKDYFFGFHVFLYLPVAVLLTRILWNQLQLAPCRDSILPARRFQPGFFLSTLFLLLMAGLLLVFGIFLLSSENVVLPPVMHQAAGVGTILYWFLLSCFVAHWGNSFR